MERNQKSGVAGRGLNIVGNSTTTKFRSYLSSLAKGQLMPQIILSSLQKYAKQFPEHKFLINMQLFLHIEIDEIRKLRDNPEFSPLAPTNYVGFSPEFYVDLVFELDLHAEFIQMIAATKGMPFSQNLLTVAGPRIGAAFKNKDFSKEIMQQYLIILGNLTRGHSDEEIESFYITQFQERICEFVGQIINSTTKETETDPKMPQDNIFELSVLLRLVGLVCMVEEDYSGENEIAELVKEWKFDPTDENALRTREVFQTGFENVQVFDSLSLPVGIQVLDILQGIFGKLSKQDCKIIPTETLSMDYIGSCAFVSKLLLQKNAKIFSAGSKSYSELLSVTSHYAKLKPRMTFEDYKTKINSFKEFCELITQFGMRKRYQDDWFQAFLDYPEALETERGLNVIENLVAPNATNQVATKLINKALSLAQEEKTTESPPRNWNSEDGMFSTETDQTRGLTNREKRVILGLLKSHKLGDGKDEWIKQVFTTGVHSVFTKDEFNNELNLISTKIGAIEIETTPEGILYYDEILYSLCFQNSLDAIKTILQTSLRSQYFKALHRVKVFLNLHYAMPSDSDALTGDQSKMSERTTVIEEVLYRTLTAVHELDPMCDYIAKGLPLLICEGLAEFDVVLKVLEAAIDGAIKVEKFEKLTKLICIYQQLVILALNRKETKRNFMEFLRSMILFTYIRLPVGKVGPFMLIREMCLKTVEMISEANPEANSLPPTTPDKFEKYTLIALGMIYIRGDNQVREQIKEFLSHPDKCWKDSTPNDDLYGKLIQSILNWVTNSCVTEWGNLLSFLDIVLKRQNYQKWTVYTVVNDFLLATKSEWECPTIFSLKFYAFVLTTLQNKEFENFSEKPEEQKLVFKTLVTLMLSFQEGKPSKHSSGRMQRIGQILQHALLILLDFTEWIVLNCNDYEKTIKEEALFMISLIEGKMRGHNSHVMPIYQSILSRFNHGRKSMTQAAQDNAPTKKLVTGPELPVPVLMSDKTFNEYVKLSAAEETMTNGEGKDKCEAREGRDLYPFHGNRQSSKKAGFKFQ